MFKFESNFAANLSIAKKVEDNILHIITVPVIAQQAATL